MNSHLSRSFQLLVLVACLLPMLVSGCASTSEAPADDPDDESTSLEQDDTLTSGKMDSASITAARARRLRPVSVLRFGDIGRVEGVPQAAWAFYGRAGSTIEIASWGAAAVLVSGPKGYGADWPEPVTPEGTLPNQTVTLPYTGLYAVQLDAPAESDEPLSVQLTCDNQDCAYPTWQRPIPDGDITLVAVGDLGLTVSAAPLDSEGGFKAGKFQYYDEMLEGMRPFINGDINLANLETAVTVRGTPLDKPFVFRMPAEALDATIDAGFNLFGLANNHGGDYSSRGVLDTIANLAAVEPSDRVHWAGAGTTLAEAAAPVVFEVAGMKIAFASCGIGYDVRSFAAGTAHVRDVDTVIAALKAADADLRIIAIHDGTELALQPTARVLAAARKATEAGIDLVHGHHPHVVEGIARHAGGLILFSMGNFALRGAANMGSKGVDKDFGLVVRLTIDPVAHRFTSIEALPITDMHYVPFAMDAVTAAARMKRLNKQSASLDGGVQLAIDADSGHAYLDL